VAGLFVKKGDTVLVVGGRDKGVKGRVISASPDTSRVLVEGVMRVKKHTKVTQSGRGSQQGGMVTQEAPVHVSNVQVVCPGCGKATRVGHRRAEADDDGKSRSVRVCKRCDSEL
jgi:large subunit ribosomal protein L24